MGGGPSLDDEMLRLLGGTKPKCLGSLIIVLSSDASSQSELHGASETLRPTLIVIVTDRCSPDITLRISTTGGDTRSEAIAKFTPLTIHSRNDN